MSKKIVAKKSAKKHLLPHKERSEIQRRAAYKAWRTIRARAKAKAAKVAARTKARAVAVKKPAASVPAVAVKVA